MNMIFVSSSAISAIGYDTMRMKIRFKDGGTYSFYRVPESVFTAFLRASSKGSYYTDHIRARYQC